MTIHDNPNLIQPDWDPFEGPNTKNGLNGSLGNNPEWDWWSSYYTSTVKNLIMSLQPNQRTMRNIMTAYGFHNLNLKKPFTAVDYINFGWKPFLRDVCGLTGRITAPGFSYGVGADANLAKAQASLEEAKTALKDVKKKLSILEIKITNNQERLDYLLEAWAALKKNNEDPDNFASNPTADVLNAEIVERTSKKNNMEDEKANLQFELSEAQKAVDEAQKDVDEADEAVKKEDPLGYSSEFMKYIITNFLIKYMDYEIGLADYDTWLAKVNYFFSLNLGLLYKTYINMAQSENFSTVSKTTGTNSGTATGSNISESNNLATGDNANNGISSSKNVDVNADLPQTAVEFNDLFDIDLTYANEANKNQNEAKSIGDAKHADLSNNYTQNENQATNEASNQSQTDSLDVLNIWLQTPNILSILPEFFESAKDYGLFLLVKMSRT